MKLSHDEVQKQSLAAMSQWGEKWRKHAKVNGEIMRRLNTSQRDISGEGMGRQLLIIANGPSLEYQMETIKKYKDNADIMCVDKCLGTLLSNGIKPKYCILADASVSFEKWLKPWLDQTSDIMLISNVNANIEWTQAWKGPIYFYVNKDNIKTEEIFSQISGCYEMIVASSNVGNTCVVFSCQVLGYDRYMLVGYDYAWYPDSNYYAFEDSDKRYWMKNHYFIDTNGNLAYTSGNLYFSCRWLNDYYTAGVQANHNGVKSIFNCSERGLCEINNRPLRGFISEKYERVLTNEERQAIINSRVRDAVSGNEKELQENLKRDVVSCVVKYINRRPSWALAS